jgi:flagellar assembly protein FliH
VSQVFKQTSKRAPRSLMVYERGVLEEIVDLTSPDAQDVPVTRETILAEARREAEQLVREAYAEGLRRGIEAGRQEFDASVSESAAALRVAADGMILARTSFLNAMEPQVLELALAVAERILQREGREDRDLIRKTARRALKQLTERESMVIRLHPDDLEAMRAERIHLLEECEDIQRISLQADPDITPGGCIVESSLVQVDARIESQWEVFCESLRELPDIAAEGQ